MEETGVVGARTTEDVAWGKPDFETAFCTLPASQDQLWLSWVIFYNPDVKRLQAALLE